MHQAGQKRCATYGSFLQSTIAAAEAVALAPALPPAGRLLWCSPAGGFAAPGRASLPAPCSSVPQLAAGPQPSRQLHPAHCTRANTPACCRVHEDCGGDCRGLRHHGFHRLLREADSHPDQQHHRGFITPARRQCDPTNLHLHHRYLRTQGLCLESSPERGKTRWQDMCNSIYVVN